jgi:nucleotide-binding universal stress UspA family protein
MYTNILHITDLNSNHILLGQQATIFAKKINADLHLLHVIEEPSSVQIAQSLGFAEIEPPPVKDAKLVLQILGDALEVPKNNLHVMAGTIKQCVLDLVQKLKIDLVILGNHNPSATPHILEHTGSKILTEPPCDVLIIKN